MIPEKLFHQLSVLGKAWRVKAVDYVKAQSKVVIRVEETLQLWHSNSARIVRRRQSRVTTTRRSGPGDI